ncbi:copper-binding protein [Ottowia sp. GY511]|uniref:Copper-binding protein n=1 Tax=Ottowia flava TaxID=2675430 RepID=A0ABW4KXN6_9BURK|nr:copper-binding protein [Ottowia sp. GY511]TXK22551.1 copper-binding protein [Ottowia sp. GY511]
MNLFLLRCPPLLQAAMVIGLLGSQGVRATEVTSRPGFLFARAPYGDGGAPVSAQADRPGSSVNARVVYTRAVVRSLPSPREPNALRLKLLPGGKIPFTTVTFRVADPSLVLGLQVGDHVGFVAEARPEGNTVVRLRAVSPCARFQPCSTIFDD